MPHLLTSEYIPAKKRRPGGQVTIPSTVTWPIYSKGRVESKGLAVLNCAGYSNGLDGSKGLSRLIYRRKQDFKAVLAQSRAEKKGVSLIV